MGVDPVSIGFMALSAVSAVKGYSDAKKAEKQQKNANRAAMQAAENEARLTKEDAAERALQEQRDAKRIRSQQLAMYMKSGVTMDGSPMLVGDETIDLGNQNAANINKNAETQAQNILLRGRAGQQPVQRADFFGTASSVLGSAKTINASRNTTKLKNGETIYWN